MEFSVKWMELGIIVLSKTTQTNITCFLSFVDVNFESSDIHCSFGRLVEIRKSGSVCGGAFKKREVE